MTSGSDKPTDPKHASPKDVARMWEVMENERTAFLITQTPAGPHARPMSAIVRADESLVWFLTDRMTIKDDEIRDDGRCAMVFTDAGSTHLAVSGTASIISDRDVVKDLWTISAKAFWPDGPDDEDIVAIKVEPGLAELWEGPAAPIAMVQLGVALATGKSAVDIGNNVVAKLG